VASSLKSRNFVPIFLTQFCGAWTDNFLKNVLLVLIVFTLGEAEGAFWVTIALGLFMLPYFLFSATAGILADRFDRAKLVRTLKLTEILLVLFAAYGFWTHHLPLLLVLLFFMGTQSAFFGPIKYALLPQHLAQTDLVKANAYVEAGTYVAILTGSIFGAILIRASHGEIICSSFLISIALLGYIFSRHIPPAPTGNIQKAGFNIFKDTAQVLKEIRSRKIIYRAIWGISWFWMVGALLLSLLVPFTQYFLNAQPTVFSYFLALFTIGVAIGAILCKKLTLYETRSTFVPLGIWIMSISLLFFCLFTTFLTRHPETIGLYTFLRSSYSLPISLSLLGIAIGGGLYTVPLYVLFQTKTPLQKMAKTVSGNNILNAFCMVLGVCVAALLEKIGFSIIHIFWILGFASVGVSILIQKKLPGTLSRSMAQLFFQSFFRVKVNGKENFSRSGKKVLIIANHASLLDGPLLGVFLPERIAFGITSEMSQKWWVKIILRFTDYYNVDPDKPFSIRSMTQKIKSGQKCMIFPEGHMTYTGRVEEIEGGAAVIAQLTRARILPIYINGSQNSKFTHVSKKIQSKWFPKITLTIYPARHFVIDENLPSYEKRQTLTQEIQKILYAMEADHISSLKPAMSSHFK